MSRGARLARISVILGLNALLLGGGIALALAYVSKRDRVSQQPGASTGSVADADLSAVDRDTPAGPTGVSGLDAGSHGASGIPHSLAVDAGAERHAAERPSAPADAGVVHHGGTTRTSADASVAARSSVPATANRADAAPRSGGFVARVDAGVVTEAPPLDPAEEERRVQVTAAKISNVVARHETQLKRCYERAAKVTTPDKPIEGRIDVHFSLQPDGSAKSARVTSNTTDSPVLAQCLLGLVGSWSFPSSGSEALDFVWPFEFKAPK